GYCLGRQGHAESAGIGAPRRDRPRPGVRRPSSRPVGWNPARALCRDLLFPFAHYPRRKSIKRMVETSLKAMTTHGDPLEDGAPCAVTVWAPARPDIVHVLRGVVASVASVLNFDYDRINDVRLATSEVVAHLLEEAPAPQTLVLRADGTGGKLDVVVARDTP